MRHFFPSLQSRVSHRLINKKRIVMAHKCCNKEETKKKAHPQYGMSMNAIVKARAVHKRCVNCVLVKIVLSSSCVVMLKLMCLCRLRSGCSYFIFIKVIKMVRNFGKVYPFTKQWKNFYLIDCLVRWLNRQMPLLLPALTCCAPVAYHRRTIW